MRTPRAVLAALPVALAAAVAITTPTALAATGAGAGVGVGVGAGAGVGGAVPAGAHASLPGAPAVLNPAFAAAAAEFDVPRDVLVAVAWGETHLDGHAGEPSHANGYGVMHLVSNPTRRTLEQAADLTGEKAETLRTDAHANVRGGAAVLRALADDAGLDAAARDRDGAWFGVVAAYGGAADPGVARMYADTVFDVLASGLQTRTPEGEPVQLPARVVKPERGALAAVTPADEPAGRAVIQGPDYPPGIWVPANRSNYSPGRSARIDRIVVHVTQGSYAGTISWFQNPSSGVSAHYVVRSADGQVTQMVRDADTAYHVRSYNARSIGLEHEGFVTNPSWFTDAMYRSSAALTRWLADRHGIPKTRAHIIGHNEAPGNDHTDPGPHWNWAYYMQLVTQGGGGSAQPMLGSGRTDVNGDGRDDVVTFTHGTLADVYVATSTGSGFAGTTVKWHDFFAPAGETALTGDFNGDGRDDIVTFTHGTLSDVHVALSTGTSFGAAAKWHDWFSVSGEAPAVGDVNGDGRDDIVTFTRNAAADVYVALSNGSSFVGTELKWSDFFGLAGEQTGLADVDGDGRDDLVAFTRGDLADVYVGLSTGTGFLGGAKWHDFFALGAETPRVGDFTGDGKADIATFTLDANADVYVATSNGSGFVGTTVKWNDFFGLAGEFPYTGDVNGDGRDDAIVFTKGSLNDVYVALSTGVAFGGGAKWHDFFGLNGETTL